MPDPLREAPPVENPFGNGLDVVEHRYPVVVIPETDSKKIYHIRNYPTEQVGQHAGRTPWTASPWLRQSGSPPFLMSLPLSGSAKG